MLKLLNWLKPKPKKHLFRVSYCTSAMVDKNNVIFDISWLHEAYVAADNLLDAGAEFAKTHVLTPHIYVHSIEQCGRLEVE